MKKFITIALGLIVLGLLSGSFFIVRETEQIVITRFGKPIGQAITTAGMHYKMPFVDKVNAFDKRILEWDGETNQISTQEKRYIVVDSTARWRIVDPLLYLQTVGLSEEDAQTRLDDLIDSAIRNEIRSNTLIEIVRNSNRVIEILEKENTDQMEGQNDDALIGEKISIGREQITRNILKKATPSLKSLGIELIDVRIKGLMYENSVLQKVFDRMISERKKIAEKIRSEGLAEKAKIEGKKDLELKKIESEAYKLAQSTKGEADAESTRIYAEAYSSDPEFYQFLKSLESYESAFSRKGTLILGTNTEFLKTLKSGE